MAEEKIDRRIFNGGHRSRGLKEEHFKAIEEGLKNHFSFKEIGARLGYSWYSIKGHVSRNGGRANYSAKHALENRRTVNERRTQKLREKWGGTQATKPRLWLDKLRENIENRFDAFQMQIDILIDEIRKKNKE